MAAPQPPWSLPPLLRSAGLAVVYALLRLWVAVADATDAARAAAGALSAAATATAVSVLTAAVDGRPMKGGLARATPAPPAPPAHVGVVLPPATTPADVAVLVTDALASGVVRALSIHDRSGGLASTGDVGHDGAGVACAVAAVRCHLSPAVRRRVRVGGWGRPDGTPTAARTPAAGAFPTVVDAVDDSECDGGDSGDSSDGGYGSDGESGDSGDSGNSGDGRTAGAPAAATGTARRPPDDRLSVTLVVGVDGRDGIAAAARALAATPPAARSADGVARPLTPAAVLAWLDRGGGGRITPWSLPGGEPDVVILAAGSRLCGFPPWQLRLALLWEPPRRPWWGGGGRRGVAELGVDGVAAAVAAARGASRRFGK